MRSRRLTTRPLLRDETSATHPQVSTSRGATPLFGHRRGSFTTAIADKKGLIEEASGGLCFLDELGECPVELQPKLLRAIESGEIMALGETKPRKVDVRFVAATNRDLNEMVQEGAFRLDLLHRMNTFTVRLLPLRERTDDILFYAGKFLESFSPRIRYFLSHGACEVLRSHSWPGNVRELRNVIERLLVLSPSRTIQPDDVKTAIGSVERLTVKGINVRNYRSEPPSYTLADIIETLKETRGNRERAAKVLGVHRATLFRWLKMYGISESVAGKVGRPALLNTNGEKVSSTPV